MDIKDLTKAMDDFVTAKGWYKPESARPQTPRNIAISINLEAAEILEHFQWSENSIHKEELADELADVALYLFHLAQISGINLEEAIIHKLDQNYKRTWE